jgi:AcrR family transcriptional regulator
MVKEYELSFAFTHSLFVRRKSEMSRSTEPRKQPQQERSRQMRARILEASIRVLRDEGALGFTTTRVADEAGVSVGSLYQYFPNKHALVLAIHQHDIEEGWQQVQEILGNRRWTPRRKLTEITRWFFESEMDEAANLGAVTGDIEVFLLDRGDHPELFAAASERFVEFIEQSSTRSRTAAQREFDAAFLMTTIEAVGKAVAARPGAPVRQWADSTATMLADHLGFR